MRVLSLTSPPMTGSDVKSAQKLLNNHGYWAGKVDGTFGDQTARACSQAKYMLGYTLKSVKPTFGEDLSMYLTGEAKPNILMKQRAKNRKNARPLRDSALEIARTFIGVTEQPAGSNKVMFSEWYGVTGPWCAMFVSYCYNKAGSKNAKAGINWAYCPTMLANAKAQKHGLTIVPKEHVQAGDVVLFDWTGDGVADHVGLVIDGPSKSGMLKTLEGNTSVASDSNGGEVMARQRHISNVIAFVRVIN